MVGRLAWRLLTGVSPRLLYKLAHLYVYKGFRTVRAWRKRKAQGGNYPPFMLLSLTNKCNLRCQGCWVTKTEPPRTLEVGDVRRLIEAGKRRRAYFYTLLGGEPFLYPGLWEIIESHPECYFQVITNGLFLDGEVVARLRRAGNVTPLVSMDGGAAANDARRGAGVHEGLQAGLERLRRAKLFFGIASTVTSANLEEVLSDDYVRHLTDLGALYLWYYIYRPMGRRPEVRLCLGPDQMALARRKILALRRRHPLLIVDTYWTAEGRAFCPAAEGLGFHVGPWGDIEPCPPLSFAAERIQDAGDPGEIIDRSVFLRSFRQFAGSCTQGCVILEQPGELAGFLGRGPARDFSGRDALAELRALPPRASHHLPGAEVPEDHWFYRFLKRQIFFGMGAYG